jgi:outer membrane protein OmpA-like peptidoglycan-associated protein
MTQQRHFAHALVAALLLVLSTFTTNLYAQDEQAQGPQKPEIRAMGVEANGVEVPVVQIRIDEYLSRQIHPLLNYIFFDDNSATIPERYHNMNEVATEAFRPERFFGVETLDVYYDVLNIIGFRLRSKPEATLNIIGCNANVGPEKGNQDLSKRRAEAVKEYLTSIWKIEPARLIVMTRDLPEKPSTSKESPLESDQENRRVELSGNWDIIEPVFVMDTLREATPPIVRFYNKMYTDAVPQQWAINIKQRNKNLRSPISAAGKPRPVVDWKINKDKNNNAPLDTVPITYDFEIRYADAAVPNEKSKRMSMPVQQITIQRKRRERLNDIEKDKYRLILFPFGSDKVEEGNAKILDFIKKDNRIKPNSKIFVTGYTDIVGSADANLKISDRRAKAVAAVLGVEKAGVVKEAKIVGRGKTLPLLYENNEMPEARFYCRTVVIEVENPVEYE